MVGLAIVFHLFFLFGNGITFSNNASSTRSISSKDFVDLKNYVERRFAYDMGPDFCFPVRRLKF